MNKNFVFLLTLLISLMSSGDAHFDRKKHYQLSLKQTQMNIHENIKQFSEDKE